MAGIAAYPLFLNELPKIAEIDNVILFQGEEGDVWYIKDGKHGLMTGANPELFKDQKYVAMLAQHVKK